MAYSDKNKNLDSVLLKRPHVTEKAHSLGQEGVYTFVVSPRANKIEIKDAIKAVYKVTPKKINVINIPSKRVFGRGRGGMKSGYRKAVVYLKKGEKIDIA